MQPTTHALASVFDDRSVDPGTNLLVSGPPLSGVRRVAFEAATHPDAATLVITTRYGADRVLAELSAAGVDTATVGIVDCVTRRQDRTHDSDMVRYAPSPAALTRIGVQFANLFERLRDDEPGQTRVVVDSVSAPLLYGETESVFRFLHVLAGRVADAGALGVHVIEPPAHDEETNRTLAGLFDGRVTVEDNAVTGVDLDG